MRTRFVNRLSVLALLSGGWLAGCGDDPGPQAGVLVVPFTLGNDRTCEELGIVAVRAELDEGMYVETADCDAGKVRFELLMPGTYQVSVFGLDAEGFEVVDSLETGLVQVTVVGEGTTVVAEPSLQLTAAPAHLLVRWDFDFGSCDSASIDRFALSAWRGDGTKLLLDTQLPCAMTGSGPGLYREVPDLDRRVSGEELGEVSVEPIDEHGIEIGGAVKFSFDSPGAGRFVKLTLACDDGGCDGSGAPD
jgi:hypothetical protein